MKEKKKKKRTGKESGRQRNTIREQGRKERMNGTDKDESEEGKEKE